MTTKTIPQYLEEERKKRGEADRCIKEEAVRISQAHHDHHRTAQEPKSEAPSPVKAVAKLNKTAVAARKKTIIGETMAIRSRRKVQFLG